jgi:hypothetical protein
MATDNKRIKVTELDFDSIKSNLKNYLRGQNQFTDYDFEGAGMSVLLDVLAYNTHYNALYHNMTVNEMFLDSAVKRSSVVSLAKMLGYTPRSARAPRATLSLTVSNVSNNPNILTLPRGSSFRTTLDGVNYFFNSDAPYSVTRSANNTYAFNNVEIIEGTVVRNKFTVADGMQFLVENPSADISTLRVTVQEDPNSAATVTYLSEINLTEIKPETRAYFVKEIDQNRFEVYFGDNIVGYKPVNGAIVTLEYYVTNKEKANQARLFTYTGSAFGSNATVNITTTQRAQGGQDEESIESIKFNASRSFAAQNRAVTADDYKVILPKLFSNIDAISVWGGEENDPPIYGKAYICIKPLSGATLTNDTKEKIKDNLLKSKNVVSILPELVDPDYLSIIVDSTVYYNSSATARSASSIKAIVVDEIKRYNQETLNKFDSVFRHSRLVRDIDGAEESIVSNVTKVDLRYEVSPNFNTVSKYRVSLNNPIYHEASSVENSYIAITSSGFKLSGNTQTFFLEDNSVGLIRMYYLTPGNEKVYNTTSVGTVNYTTGVIELNNLSISSGNVDGKLVLFIEPSSYDVVSVRNQLTNIREQDIVVNVIADRVASGESSSGNEYIHTVSR